MKHNRHRVPKSGTEDPSITSLHTASRILRASTYNNQERFVDSKEQSLELRIAFKITYTEH